ncbi:hypothetical protein [uncultured Metabacillus sp.]|uniref:hypothetical protein n=1 Tax=uncultured Metabacillus sp. TaxID=2860135 RepID=UPI0026321F2A|nr:hypothetical protein [uncultured Metabacillus sp.]
MAITTGTEGAERFNQPILDLVGDDRIFPLENCIEDILGYPAPSSEKPYRAYRYINSNWGDTWDDCTGDWKTLIERIFSSSFALQEPERRAHRQGTVIRGATQIQQQTERETLPQ